MNTLQMLKERFGVQYLRPYQELIISYILEHAGGRNQGRLLACLPTGSGKSLCFMYPAALGMGRCIFIYPLLSLMNDQAERFRKAGIRHVVLRGGMEEKEYREALRMIREDGSISVITNPEMLLAIRKRHGLSMFRAKTLMMVIDEAHTAVTWGESFREACLMTGKLAEEIQPDILAAFTATMDREIWEGIIKHVFSGVRPYTVRASPDRENIFYHFVRSLSPIHDAESLLSSNTARPAIIFCRSRKLAESTAERLSHAFPCRAYHAGMEKEARAETEKWFLSSHDGILAATSAYGMGVDKSGIRTIIHLSMPSSVPDFLQEAGRGGRDGKRMDSYVLAEHGRDTDLRDIFSGGCIRHGLLSAMGYKTEHRECLACSACVPDGYIRAGEREITRWISFHPGASAGNAAAALVSEKLLSGKNRLRGWTEKEAEAAIHALAQEGRILMIHGRLLCLPEPLLRWYRKNTCDRIRRKGDCNGSSS